MLTDRLQVFFQRLHAALGRVGNNAPRAADIVISEAFPDTSEAAHREGADAMLRDGVIAFISKYLKRTPGDIGQHDFSEIDPGFVGIVQRLQNPRHYVPSLKEYVSVPELIADPSLLDEARRFKRQKGEETLAEAKVLDELYDAVIRKRAA